MIDRGLDPAQVIDPLAYGEEMRSTARAAAGPGEITEKLDRLRRFLFDSKEFGFVYEVRETYTAAEAFEQRRGNCVAITNLFIAMARSLGLEVDAALLSRGDTERDGDLVVVNTHMVAVIRHSRGLTFYDFNGIEDRPITGGWILDDPWVGSIYFNNRGAEDLRRGDYDTAIGRFETAIRLAPRFAAPYANQGVALRLAGRPQEALAVYRQALEFAEGNPTLLNNLAKLYQELGRQEEAEAALKAADLSAATPYLLVARADLERSQGRDREARRLYRRARRADPGLALPWLGLARLELDRGRLAQARRALAEALEAEPESSEARRFRERLDAATSASPPPAPEPADGPPRSVPGAQPGSRTLAGTVPRSDSQ